MIFCNWLHGFHGNQSSSSVSSIDNCISLLSGFLLLLLLLPWRWLLLLFTEPCVVMPWDNGSSDYQWQVPTRFSDDTLCVLHCLNLITSDGLWSWFSVVDNRWLSRHNDGGVSRGRCDNSIIRWVPYGLRVSRSLHVAITGLSVSCFGLSGGKWHQSWLCLAFWWHKWGTLICYINDSLLLGYGRCGFNVPVSFWELLRRHTWAWLAEGLSCSSASVGWSVHFVGEQFAFDDAVLPVRLLKEGYIIDIGCHGYRGMAWHESMHPWPAHVIAHGHRAETISMDYYSMLPSEIRI